MIILTAAAWDGEVVGIRKPTFLIAFEGITLLAKEDTYFRSSTCVFT